MRAVRLLVLASVLAAGAACSSTTDESAPQVWSTAAAASGTRLRARFLAGGDARAHVGFRDSERNEDCTFQTAEGGRMRCLPETQSYVSGQTYFSDATCTTPVSAFAQQGCGLSKYAVATAYDAAVCRQAPRELRRVIGPATVFLGGPGSCAPVTTPLVVVGEIVPWTDFVEATATAAAGATSALRETLLVASDGARQHEGFRSANVDEACAFEVMADGVARCVPDGRKGVTYFSDDTCTTPAAALVGFGSCSRAPAARFLLQDSSAAGATCNALRGVYDLVDYAADSSSNLHVYSPTGSSSVGSCSSGIDVPSGGYGQERRGFGKDLTPALPVATQLSAGRGRLVPALVSADDTRALVPGWHDTERDTDCTFRLASDGKMRCLPAVSPSLLFFGDDTCTSATKLAAPTKLSCSAKSAAFALVQASTCPVTSKVFALGTSLRGLGAASTETAPGRCAKVGGVSGGYDATEVDPAQFVEGVPVTE